jgi:hypothetical protein
LIIHDPGEFVGKTLPHSASLELLHHVRWGEESMENVAAAVFELTDFVHGSGSKQALYLGPRDQSMT